MSLPRASLTLLLMVAACQNQGLPLDKTDTADPLDSAAPDDTAPEPPADADGDGWTEDDDCDDGDATVNPGADEVENDLDDDCDGIVDELEVCLDDTAPFGTIQGAIDAAVDGDVVQVCPGTWYENPVIAGTSVTVVSMEGPEVTIVDGAGRRVWTVMDVAGRAAVEGFTIRNGAVTDAGAGLLCSQATLTVTDNIFTANEAPSGGGLFAQGCQVALSGNSFEGNDATDYGGGACFYRAWGTASGNTFAGNAATYGGGLAVVEGGVEVTANTFSDNDVVSFGGGLYVAGGSAITGNTFANNVSDDDGGGAYVYYGSGDFTGNTVTGNTCGNDGAGVYFSVSTSLVSGNVFTANDSLDDAGGLRIYFGAQVVEENEFYGNTAADDGGGCKMSHSGSNTFRYNHLEGNTTGDAGGGIEMDNETSPLYGNTFVGNAARRGGGLHTWRNEHTHEIHDCTFTDNVATDCGGGISIDNDAHRLTLTHLVFSGNQAVDGGAVCADEVWWDSDDDGKPESWVASDVEVLASIFTGNSAADEGAAFYAKASTATLGNLAVHANASPNGAIRVEQDSTLTLVNTIVTGTGSGPGVSVDASTAILRYNDLHDNDGGPVSGLSDPTGTNGNLAVDPSFTDAAGGDFTLASGSPCIDAGDPAFTDSDGSRSDMGAYGGSHGSW